jgi:hypothetical protein
MRDHSAKKPPAPGLPTSPLSRRSFLSRAGATTAAAAAAMGMPSLPMAQENGCVDSGTADSEGSGPVDARARRERSFQIRIRAARKEHGLPVPAHIDNGDEDRYPNRIGSFSKGLPHDAIGEVDAAAYDSLLTAVGSGEPSDFANIPLGGNTKLAGPPQAGLCYTLQGTENGQLSSPPAPALASAERAGEMVEDYWMALARDIPFTQYGNEPLTAAAIADLNRMSDFRGPKVGGGVTPSTLFRGITPGELIGPYVSQFLLLPVPYGTLNVPQKYSTYAAGTEYQTDPTSWLASQNGYGPSKKNDISSGTTYIKNGRDLGAYVHVDYLGEASLTAALWLLVNRAPLNPGNPYLRIANQAPNATFGHQHILALTYEVSLLALKAVMYQKWFVHRTVRPETYAGLVHNTLTRVSRYPLHTDVLNSQAVSQTFSKFASYLLPAAYPEGCPQHPSYPEAHGVAVGAAVTALKALFDERYVIPRPMGAADDGQSLVPYTGGDAGQITVGGELNKLAGNVALGRDIAAVHWRSDALQGVLLGEAVAISILRDQHSIFNEPFEGFTFTRFDGSTITV